MNSTLVTARANGTASGKVLISGEHSVVYGYPALVAAISGSSTAYVVERKSAQQQAVPILESFTEQLLEVFFAAFPHIRESGADITLQFETDLPIQSGLGSSASFATAGLRALAQWADVSLQDDNLFRLAIESERFMHGNPSGADAAAVVYQGVLRCQKVDGVLQRQRVGLSSHTLPSFFLIQSGKPAETTKEMVTYVRTRYDDSSAYRDVLHQIGETTIEMQRAMEQAAFSAFLRCVEENQALLSQLGVVSESTEKLIAQLRDIGAVAKVTGAGGRKQGSGMVLVFHEDPDTLLEFCKTHEYDYLETTIEHGRLI